MLRVKADKRAIGFDIKMAWLAISRMYNQKAARGGISTNTGFVLLHIDEKNGTPATKIAPLMGMEPRSLSRILARMEQEGLIRREPDANDRRMVRIFPTDMGLEIKAAVKEEVIAFNKELYGRIPAHKLDTFFEVLDNIQHIIKTTSNANSRETVK
ncbi:MAG: MarR family transcriptional regulator [Bacteroidota bacterium]